VKNATEQRAAPAVLPGANEKCWCGSGRKYKRCCRDSDEAARAGRVLRRASALEKGVVSPRRAVPPTIERPDYAETGQPGPATMPEVKSGERLERMRRACRAAANVLAEVESLIEPGVTTDAIDALVHDACIKRGAYPSPLNYRGFPKSVCTSVNEVICHGIPDDRPLQEGDICNVDVTLYLDGMHGDTNRTFFVGKVDDDTRRLVDVTHACMMRGFEAVKPGGQIRDIGRAISSKARSHGYSVVRSYCGHGIGETFHSRMQIPHYYEPRATTVFEPGMTFTIEPMINEGRFQDRQWDDGWTVVTADGKRSAQFEHTILVTETGAEILTLPDA